MQRVDRALLVPVFAVALGLAAPAAAITVTATQNTTALVNALLGAGGTGILVTGVSLAGHAQDLGGLETSSGTFSNASGTYGIGSGVVLSTGAVERYGDGGNTEDEASGLYFDPVTFEFAAATPAQEALLDPITTVGGDTFQHFDVTELVISFDMQPGQQQVRFNVVFGSEEYPEFVNDGYFDGFGMFLNGTNVAFVRSLPVNITHPDMTPLPGTELDGVLAPGGNPLLVFGGAVNQTGNTLRFIIGDREDSILDSTVYISGLRAPEPGSTETVVAALCALGVLGRTRRAPASQSVRRASRPTCRTR